MATRRTVLAGPSKFDLMLSLMERKVVTFSLEGLQAPVQVIITGAAQEDGSCHSWNVHGRVHDAENRIFTGWFRTDRRSGFLEIA